jgi:hypothetical protein
MLSKALAVITFLLTASYIASRHRALFQGEPALCLCGRRV